jgi:hypothetical protein
MTSPTPTISDFDELLGYLPMLYTNGFKPIPRWHDGNQTDAAAIIMGQTEYDEVVEQFFNAAARECWCDYQYDPKSVGKMIRDPHKIAHATLQEIKSMLTWCVRGERFCGGHWGNVIGNGHIRNILLRLQALRPQ